tara:strand:+ start:2672 stop:3295 length:624 start_codon:yes stop_codon:yes gene_type:complete
VYLENIYWFYDKALPPSFCNDIIKFGKMIKEQRAVTTGKKSDELTEEEEKELSKIRNSRVAWIEPMRWMNVWFHELMEQANKDAGWNFDIDDGEPYQFTKYTEGQFYGWHQDVAPHGGDGWHDGLSRKLSLVACLTDPSEYEGGNLEIVSPNLSPIMKLEKKTFSEPEWLNQGTVILFPSDNWHQVKKVTKGTRYSLVTWFRGKDFK